MAPGKCPRPQGRPNEQVDYKLLTFNSPWPALSNLRHVLPTPHNIFLAGCTVATLQNHVEREAHANARTRPLFTALPVCDQWRLARITTWRAARGDGPTVPADQSHRVSGMPDNQQFEITIDGALEACGGSRFAGAAAILPGPLDESGSRSCPATVNFALPASA